MAKGLSLVLMVSMLVLLSGVRPEDAKSDDAVSLANAPPVVVKTVPESGKDGVDPAITDIKVTYSKDMMDHTWSWSTWGEGTFPQTTGKPHYQVDNRTCVLPVRLGPGKTYAIWLNSDNFRNFKDSKGNSAVPYLLIFRTKDAN
jgi:RNA polymerase sigma-70 factor (ECF subfamily)